MQNFDGAVNKIAKRDGLPRTASMQKARSAYPELFARYQDDGRDAVAKAAPKPIGKSAAVINFEKLIDRVQTRDQCGRLQAMMKTAREYPAEQKAYADALS